MRTFLNPQGPEKTSRREISTSIDPLKVFATACATYHDKLDSATSHVLIIILFLWCFSYFFWFFLGVRAMTDRRIVPSFMSIWWSLGEEEWYRHDFDYNYTVENKKNCSFTCSKAFERHPSLEVQ